MNIFSQGFWGFFADYDRVFYEYDVNGYGLGLYMLQITETSTTTES
jgi:hypothetical protein